MPQSKVKVKKMTTTEGIFEEAKAQIQRGLDYIILVEEHGENSARVRKFLKSNPTAKRDYRSVRKILIELLSKNK